MLELDTEDTVGAITGVRDALKRGQPLLVLAVGIRMRSRHRHQDSEVVYHASTI